MNSIAEMTDANRSFSSSPSFGAHDGNVLFSASQAENFFPHGLKLSQYQLAGVNWMIILRNCATNGIIADEMGLGKTVQTVGFTRFMTDPTVETSHQNG